MTIGGSLRQLAVQSGLVLAGILSVSCSSPDVTEVPPVLQRIAIAPVDPSVAAGMTQQFTATGHMSDGSTTSPAVDWSATGGSITASGDFTAGTSTGAYLVVARQHDGTLADTTQVTVTPPVLTQVILTPATATLAAGLTQQFAVSGRLSDGATTTPSVTWSATGGTITSSGLFTAGNTAGSFRVIAKQQGGTLADTSAVTISSAVLTQVIVTPVSASVPSGLTQQFTASGKLSDGSTTAPAVTWTATGGTVTTAGLYTAGNTTGAFHVIATQQGGTLADTSTITITAAVLTQVIVTPPTASVAAGLTQQFAVSGVLSNGAATTPSVTWTATGGTISAAGLYTAGNTTGAFRVIATQQGGTLADTAAVTIASAVLTQVIVTPPSASVPAGLTQQFTSSGKLSDGSTTAPAVTWTATGGSITVGGLFTAGATPGSYRVIATQQGGTLADTSTVTVTAAVLTQVIVTPPTASVAAGLTQQFAVSGVLSDGAATTPSVTWTATGGTISAAGLYTAGSTTGAFRVIATQQGGTLADTSSVTITGAVLSQVILTPATASVPAGLTQQFTVSGKLSDGSTTTPTVTYTATGGSISAGGLYSAGATPGSYRVIATQQGGTLADTSTVTVTTAVLTQVILTPASVSLAAGLKQQFAVSGQLSDGSTTTPAVSYSATGGTITAAGLFTAGSTPGSYQVIAVQQGGTLADTAAVTVTAPVLTQLVLTPPAVTLAEGLTQQFAVSGTWSDGSTTTPTVTYTATGGTVTAGGLYTAGSTMGTFRVIAVQQGGTVADTSTVTITSAVLTQVILSPSTASVPEGLTQQFTVSGLWSDGSSTPPAVSFSATGGTITAGGLYTAGSGAGTFRVIATQQGGTLADTSSVTVTAPVLTSITLSPPAASIPAGLTQQFSVSGLLSDGSTSTPAVNYSATGGTITAGGLYTAGNTTGTFRVIAVQQGGTLADTSAVTITTPVLTQVIVAPPSVTLAEGLTQQFAVSGTLSDGSSTTPAVTWTATGGTISAAGLYTAGNSTGSFRVIATQQGGTLADTAAVTVTSAVLTQVILTPPSASVAAGLTQQFAVSGLWSDGSTTAPAVNYTATGGTITAGGLYAAGSTTGSFRVIATQQGGTLADTSAVTITTPVLTQVNVTPPSVTLAEGLTQQFTVSGTLSDGSSTTPAVTWVATGGTISAGGLYTAGTTTGSFRVVATQQGGTLADTAAITIGSAVLTQVILTPPSASVAAGLTQQFSVSGLWSDGSSTPPAVNYTATGGTITAGGLYTAGATTGSFRVIATQQGGTLADTSSVTITSPVLTQLTLSPPTASVAAGLTQQFTVSGVWSDGSSTTPVVTYTATGGTITSGGLYTAGSTQGSFRVIAVQQGGTLADTSAVTITAPVLTQLSLTPATVTLTPSGTQQFAVSGVWSDGSTTTPVVTYSATGGSITAGGLYTAGATVGGFQVIAVQQGGTLADTSAVTIGAGLRTYSTTFPLTELPVSEGGNWVNGFTDGKQWSDVQTTPGLAFGRQQIDWARSYSDGTALLTGTWAANQQATATVFSTGPAPDNYYQEVELRLRSNITANSNTGYEISFKVSSNSSAYLIVVRWNGAWGDFTYLPGGGSGSQWGVKNGDVVSATIIGNQISVYKNGVLVTTSTDNTYTSGAPGIGFNLEAAGAGTNSNYGFSSFSAAELP
ncbi:MAG TPA: Ig-like domain-containing protein [Gemmatimonadales bacterium]|nr:Ig-like domain-containing protein [Gemmatimonadales bacterium]